jgi:hypothetical protein
MKLNDLCNTNLKAENIVNLTGKKTTGCPVHGRMTFLLCLATRLLVSMVRTSRSMVDLLTSMVKKSVGQITSRLDGLAGGILSRV